ncbi:unnamed protein product (mitochondrion) [Plasmodiophora brassicae]|uniref:Uncharacterized protein n=1 Tax=Plasmodiophora brassicae TaxID=37360 RepID=A0A3P3YH32_PLABS|nr:unnamed protein product [Plasmodiophora brassicae]
MAVKGSVHWRRGIGCCTGIVLRPPCSWSASRSAAGRLRWNPNATWTTAATFHCEHTTILAFDLSGGYGMLGMSATTESCWYGGAQALV